MANRLEHRLVAAANADLWRHRFVAPVDVLIGLGWLSKEHAEAWRRRRVPYLEQVTEASLGKLSSALRILQSWAQSEGLQPREAIYVSWTPSRHRLRFTKTGEENLERAYRTHWISPKLIEAEQQRKAEAAARGAVLLADELEAVSRAAFLAHRTTAEDPGSDPGLPPELRATVDQAADDWPGGAGALVMAIADAAPRHLRPSCRGPCLSIRTRPWRWRPGAPPRRPGSRDARHRNENQVPVRSSPQGPQAAAALKRQLGATPNWGGPAMIAALGWLLPGHFRLHWIVTPGTLLAWRRRMVKRNGRTRMSQGGDPNPLLVRLERMSAERTVASPRPDSGLG